MMKNCIMYRFAEEFRGKWQVDENSAKKSKLADCLRKATGRPKPRIKALTEIARKERLALSEETREHFVFSTECEFRVPKLLAAGISPFVPVSHGIWLRKGSSLVVSFDAGRKLSGVGNTLLSYATTGNPSSIEPVRLDKDHFLRLRDWLLSGRRQGEIRRIALHDTQHDKWTFKQVVLNASQLHDSPLFARLVDSALAVANMSFVIPPLDSTERQLSLRLNHWGGLTIYTPDLLDSEISELIGIFENLLLPE